MDQNISVDLLDATVKWNGEIAPITNYFVNEDNTTVFDLTKVITVVAGPYSNGNWLSTEVSDEERAEARKIH